MQIALWPPFKNYSLFLFMQFAKSFFLQSLFRFTPVCFLKQLKLLLWYKSPLKQDWYCVSDNALFFLLTGVKLSVFFSLSCFLQSYWQWGRFTLWQRVYGHHPSEQHDSHVPERGHQVPCHGLLSPQGKLWEERSVLRTFTCVSETQRLFNSW